ncbi:hypothetical protein L2E82_24848 [Cichorium intybus]|uniref:Uncharacterized protein n=1 Tax=Cichorium intybus TaxID=13427 RepID=A0ACB9E267_CICIN|nr:hypothetical protein L2E82_24848 [Cichorium intybus]
MSGEGKVVSKGVFSISHSPITVIDGIEDPSSDRRSFDNELQDSMEQSEERICQSLFLIPSLDPYHQIRWSSLRNEYVE